MGKKLKVISKVSVALALLGAAVPAVEAAPTTMAAKKTTKKAKKAKKAKKGTKKKSTKKVAKTTSKKKVTKKPIEKVTPKTVKTAKKSPAAKGKLVPIHFESIWGKVTDYYSKNGGNFSGMARLYNLKGKALNYYVKRGGKFTVYGQTTINGQLMYNIYCPDINTDFKNRWVPAKDIQVDYFSNVMYVEYGWRGETPAQRKANYFAELADAEKNHPEDAEIFWYDAHPLEDLRDDRDMSKISKSTYEKHNISFAQMAAELQRGGNSGCYTEEAYKAYMKGEAAYRQYEARWDAKYPNLAKYIRDQDNKPLYTYVGKYKEKITNHIKKYHLNTFEWHFSDNYYTVDNIRK